MTIAKSVKKFAKAIFVDYKVNEVVPHTPLEKQRWLCNCIGKVQNMLPLVIIIQKGQKTLKVPFLVLQCEEQNEERRSALDNAISESRQAGCYLRGVNLIYQL